MTTYAALWNTGSGNFFSAGNWDVDNPDPPPGIIHIVPGRIHDVYIGDRPTPFTVTFNGTRELNTLRGSANAHLDITGGHLTLRNGGLTFLGTMDVAAGATFTVTAGTFTYGGGDLNGVFDGGGTLRFIDGVFNVNAGTSITVDTWLLSYQVGSGTVSRTELNTDLSYANKFLIQQIFGNYPVLDLNGHTLTLSGTALFDGVVRGPGTVLVTGAGTVNGGSFVDGATLRVSGTTEQQGSLGLEGTLLIDAGATYVIKTASNIASVGDGPTAVENDGSLRVTGAGISRLQGTFQNDGTLLVGNGAELSLEVGAQTLNGSVTGQGKLTFGFAHDVTLNTSALSVHSILVAGGNGGGTVRLAKSLAYGGNFTLNDTGVFDLAGFTFTLSGTASLVNGNVDGLGMLRVTGSATIGGGLNLGQAQNGIAEAANAVTLRNAGTMTQTAGIGLNGTLLNDAGKSYTISQAANISSIGALGASVVNNGTFGDYAAGVSIVSGNLTNNGTVLVTSPATLVLERGAHQLNGSLTGAGQLTLGFAHNATLNTDVLSVNKIYINGGNGGGTVRLAKDISYARTFQFDNQFGTFDLNGFTLTLSGAKTLSAGVIDGPGTMHLMGASTVGFIGIGTASGGSAATLRNSGTLTQNGTVQLAGTVLNDAGRTYKLVASNVENPFATGVFTNHGTLAVQKSGSLTASAIHATFSTDGALTLATGATLRLGGTSTLEGTIGGAGSLVLAGTSSINTAITTASLALNGTATLSVNLNYARDFSVGAFSTTNLNGRMLTLSGTAHLDTGFNSIVGPGTLRITGEATIGGIRLGVSDALTFRNSGTVDQIGNVQVRGTILNDLNKTYTLYASSIETIAAAAFTNNGNLVVRPSTTSAATDSVINAAFTNNGTLTVTSGASLRLGGTNLIDGTVSGLGSLTLAGSSTVRTSISTAALTFAQLTTLAVNFTYDGAFATGAFSTVNLNGRILALGGTFDLDAGFSSIVGPGTLKLIGEGTIGGLALGTGSDIVTVQNTGTVTQTGGISVAGRIFNEAGGVYTVHLGDINGAGQFFRNNGTFEKDGDAGTISVNMQFTNNGLIVVDEGTARFQNLTNVGIIEGVVTQEGSVTVVKADAPGELTLTGGTGNNRIVVETAPTHVDGGAGTDTLVVAADMSLAAGSLTSVERIEVADGVSADLSNLTAPLPVFIASKAGGGSEVRGTNGADTFNGGAGDDTMRGGAGNDVYVVQNAGDLVIEASNQGIDLVRSSVTFTLRGGIERLTLTGSADVSGTGNGLDNTIIGNTGANLLRGSTGNDTLTGGAGHDGFVFNTALNDATNVDHITDFAAGDLIRVDDAIFTGLSTGALAAAAFKDLATGTVDGNDRILYNSATGDLFYDANGSAAGQRFRFAVLDNHYALTAGDILVV